MAKPIKNKLVFSFKEGQILDLDNIDGISGLFCAAGNSWWEPEPDSDNKGFRAEGEKATQCSGETIRITRNITIEIIER